MCFKINSQGMLVDKNNILELIPQRPPMVMIDQLIACTEKEATTTFTISEENVFCEGGVFSEAGLIENIAQTAAAQVGYICKEKNIPVPIGFIGALKNLEIFFFPKAGEKIISSIQIENEVMGITLISGKVLCNDKVAARTEMKIMIKQ